jgi:iron complex outermembrane receptor protein
MQTTSATKRALLAVSVALSALITAPAVWAAEAAADSAGPKSTTTTEGVEVSEVVVTVERNKAAAAAPSKASLDEVQPESIITRKFIEQATPETGDYTTTVFLAPSMAGVSSNGGGVGETNKITLRGFQDGQFNITYDGIAFGDTNDPTHHTASYWPASTIGAAVIDRGPGQAGDLGQANFGGAIHFFSPELSDKFGASQKATYGSFDTQSYVTTVQSGSIAQLNGAKLLLNFDERTSNGELSESSGVAQNQLLKFSMPIADKYTLTLFGSHNYTRFYQADAGPGETYQQVELFGKNFALNNDPKSEHYYGYNHEKKATDFEYVDFKGEPGLGFTFEDQLYTYFYSNKTIATNDITGYEGPDLNGTSSKANTDVPKNSPGQLSTDIGGYDKGNRYRVYGDIIRLNKAFDFGTLKTGAVYETSTTDRHNILYDLTDGLPDNKYSTTTPLTAPYNAKTIEYSHWRQYQLFADFEWKPIDNLTITPGIKQVHFTRVVEGPVENSLGDTVTVRGSVNGSNTYDTTLYFGTVNYKIKPFWSVYAQTATGFLVPSLTSLYVPQNDLSLQSLQPERTTNYQLGTVYTRGHITADLDVYTIKVSNLAVADPTGQFYVNAGLARFSGIEGEAAYAFDFGLTPFANFGLNGAKNLTSDTTELNAAKYTAAAGLLFNHGRWAATASYKIVGPQVVAYNGAGTTVTPEGISLAPYQSREIGEYDTIDASLAYDFGHFKLKFAGFNLADKRNLTSLSGITSTSLYQYQVGRQLQVTLQAKF